MEKSAVLEFLERQSQESWNQVLSRLLPSMHPVDRMATRIWFAFWPLDLHHALREPGGAEEMARIMDLEGCWRLEKEIDRSVTFLYGALHWWAVKKAVLAHAEQGESPEQEDLEQQIRTVAQRVARDVKQEQSLLLGVTAVAFMILQQVGLEALRAVADKPMAASPHRGSPQQVLKNRARKSRDGLFGFLKGAGRRYGVIWDEKKVDARFKALHGQDLAMAAASDLRSYRSMDYRRVDGPIPVECRVGSCGYCWVGLLSGKDHLSEISDFEKERLNYFGYDTVNDPEDPRPPVRLACQAQCTGDVTVAISHWNGELKRRLNKTPKLLGTA